MEPNISQKLTRSPPSPNAGTAQIEANVRTGMEAADLWRNKGGHSEFSQATARGLQR
jgi:hypothetical protein